MNEILIDLLSEQLPKLRELIEKYDGKIFNLDKQIQVLQDERELWYALQENVQDKIDAIEEVTDA